MTLGTVNLNKRTTDTGPTLRGRYDQGDGSGGFRQVVEVGDMDSFSRPVMVQETPVIELKPIYGLSAFRDVQTQSNGATVSNTGDEHKIASGTTGTGKGVLETAAKLRYMPGADAKAGIGVRTTGTPASGQTVSWGAFNDSDGFGFRLTSSTYQVFIRRGSSDTTVDKANWNGDKLDGNGASGYNLSSDTDELIWQVRFSWYGYGKAIEYQALVPWADGKQRPTIVHILEPSGGQTSVADPNLPVRAEVDNGGATTSYDLFIGGRQAAVVGRYLPDFRVTSEPVFEAAVAGSANPTALLTMRHKSGSKNIAAKLSRLSIKTDTDLAVFAVLNASLSGASFGALTYRSASETAFEADTSGSFASNPIGGGEIITPVEIIEATGSGNNSGGADAATVPRFDIPAEQNVTLAARPLDGSTAATVSAELTMREDW